MSKNFVFQTGRSATHEPTTNVLRYVPRARNPWQPSMVWRENVMPNDLKSFWDTGRGRHGPTFPNSGYHQQNTHVWEDSTVSLIPKHELEKYMPDINLGPKAFVTPVSLMHARNGHRVTHDMLYSYDPYIGKNEALSNVDHDNISVEDPNRVGLHPNAIHCRGRIYRWLRRGPFFQEDHYFRRNVAPRGNITSAITPEDVQLARKVIKLARRGHLKSACDEYRKFVSVPPVEVYRALTAACVAGGKLGDAIEIFEDGNSKLFYVSRDGEVLKNVMKTAIKAKNRARVMWVYNVARGRFYENKLAKAEIEPLTMYRLCVLALEFLLDHRSGEEARTIYHFMSCASGKVFNAMQSGAVIEGYQSHNFLNFDLYIRIGKQMQDALASGNKISSFSPSMMNGLSLTNNVDVIAPALCQAIAMRDAELQEETGGNLNICDAVAPLKEQQKEHPMEYLQRRFSDVDVAAIVRLARFRRCTVDLLKGQDDNKIQEYIDRCVSWLVTLSASNAREHEQPAMPYLRKSKPSTVNSNVRVAWLPENRKVTHLLPSESGFSFYYSDANLEPARFVEETYPQVSGTSVRSMYLALQPIHSPVAATIDFMPSQSSDNATKKSRHPAHLFEQHPSTTKLFSSEEVARPKPPVPSGIYSRRSSILHPSVLRIGTVPHLHGTVDSASAATSGGVGAAAVTISNSTSSTAEANKMHQHVTTSAGAVGNITTEEGVKRIIRASEEDDDMF
eukprot:Tbor_TRINITY_DN3909_c0_g1::TRINITY_DN3909_c0_g1_i1::g.825::m.825